MDATAAAAIDKLSKSLPPIWHGQPALKAALAALRSHPQAAAPGEGRRWQHRKRGSTYTEIGRGKIQADYWHDYGSADADRVDMSEVVIYRADADESLWVRPVTEFEDGRFEALPALCTSQPASGGSRTRVAGITR